jgi:DNA-binding transcriptional LysR family regulator
VELRRLKYFLAVAEELHFGRAAERLHIVQPAISRQIALLEAELGLKLFERTKRRVSLTPAGEVFATDVRQVLHRLDHSVETARRVAAGKSGRLEIGFIGPVMDSFLPRLLAEHRADAPDVVVDLHEMGSASQVAALCQGTLDCGFVRLPARADELSFLTLFRESIVIARPRSHPLSEHRSLPLAALAREWFIMIPREWEPGLYQTYIALCANAGFTPNVAQETNSIHSVLGLVAAETGVAFVPASVTGLRKKNVVYRPLQEARLLEVAAAWRTDSTSRTLPAFLEIAARHAVDEPIRGE